MAYSESKTVGVGVNKVLVSGCDEKNQSFLNNQIYLTLLVFVKSFLNFACFPKPLYFIRLGC